MANERKYYVYCADNCKFEGMTKEQILTAIEQAISTGEIKDVDSGFITTIKEQNAQSGLKFWVGTIAEFNALTEMQDDCLYIFTDENIVEDIDAAFVELEKRTAAVEKKVFPQGKILYNGELPNGYNLEEQNIIVEDIGNYELVKVECGNYSVVCSGITAENVSRFMGIGTTNVTEAGIFYICVEMIFDKQTDGTWLCRQNHAVYGVDNSNGTQIKPINIKKIIGLM